jgi:hypothetical protein
LVIATLAPKPLPLSQDLLYWTEHPAAANALDEVTTIPAATSAQTAAAATTRGGRRHKDVNLLVRIFRSPGDEAE